MSVELGARIRAARLQSGISTAELARAVGMSPQTITAWERGTREPNVACLKIIARALNTTIDELAGYEIDAGVSADGRLFGHLTPAEIREVNIFVQYLIAKRKR